MRILVLGSGAREHAIVKALIRTGSNPEQVFCAPGNAGITQEVVCFDLDITNPQDVSELAILNQIELVIIGPEAPLVFGVANELRRRGVWVFGPDQKAAELEGSKAFAKEIMAAAGVPTGLAKKCSSLDDVWNALDELGSPFVVKADGLAAGKGVIVTSDRNAALSHAEAFLNQGMEILVEEFLDGEEVSLFFLSDGTTVKPLAPAQDFKRAFHNDEGPNTGGMGAYSPLPWLPKDFVEEVTDRVALPTIKHMAIKGSPFIGLLYCGLIVTAKGIKVIEFNARFGDPETQVVLRRLVTPLELLLHSAATGRLAECPDPEFLDDVAITVVLASEGYPLSVAPRRIIGGLTEAATNENVDVAHAATKIEGEDLVAVGGRVLSVVSLAKTFSEARNHAYEAISKISLEGSHYRKDIAKKVSGD